MRIGLLLLVILATGSHLLAGEIDIVDVWASSTLKGKNNKYAANKVIDKTFFSWCEGKKGDGIGESVTLKLSGEDEVNTIKIKNGYGNKKYWGKNNRVKHLEILARGKRVEVIRLDDSRELQELELDTALTVDELELRINSIYRGTKWQDTCIAEISLEGPTVDETDMVGVWWAPRGPTSQIHFIVRERGYCEIYVEDHGLGDTVKGTCSVETKGGDVTFTFESFDEDDPNANSIRMTETQWSTPMESIYQRGGLHKLDIGSKDPDEYMEEQLSTHDEE